MILTVASPESLKLTSNCLKLIMFYVYDTDSSIHLEFSCSLQCKVSPFFGKIYASLFSDDGPSLRAILSHLIDH